MEPDAVVGQFEAQAAGVTGKLWELTDIVDMIEEWEAANANANRSQAE